MDNVLHYVHTHKSSIISSGVQTRKGGKVIDNWFIAKLKLLQSVSSNICQNGVAMQWTTDITEWCHITKIKVPSCSTNNRGYESQICHYLNCKEKCQQFDLATAIREAQVNSHSLLNNMDCKYLDGDEGNLF